MELTEEEKNARKRQKQHEAWKRWYETKGKAYLAKKRKKKPNGKSATCPGCTDPICMEKGCQV